MLHDFFSTNYFIFTSTQNSYLSFCLFIEYDLQWYIVYDDEDEADDCGSDACAWSLVAFAVLVLDDEDADKPGVVGVVAINFCLTSLIFNCRVFLFGKIALWRCWNSAVSCAKNKKRKVLDQKQR